MTVSKDNIESADYVGDGLITQLPFNFYHDRDDNDAAIKLFERQTDGSYVQSTLGFSVIDDTSDDEAGIVILDTPLAIGTTVKVVRDTPLHQEQDIDEVSRFDPKNQEKAYDKLTTMIQEVFKRCLKVGVGNGAAPLIPRFVPNAFLKTNAAGAPYWGDATNIGAYGDSDVTAFNQANGVEAAVGYDTADEIRALGTPAEGVESVILRGNQGGRFNWVDTSTQSENGVSGSAGTVIAATDHVGAGRWLREYSQGVLVDWFGALADNSTDSTSAIQAAIFAAFHESKTVLFGEGTYLATNLLYKGTEWRGQGRKWTKIKRLTGGDDRYFITSDSWLNGGIYAADPTGFYDLWVDGNGADYALPIRSYFTKIINCRVSGSAEVDVLFTSDASNGDPLTGSTMVNNVIDQSWIGVDGGTARFNVLVEDSTGVCTDYHLTNNYFSGATEENVKAVTTAGWNIEGNHFYGAPISLRVKKPNLGTRVNSNYFESDVWLSTGGAGYPNWSFGSGNFFLEHLYADFENNSEVLDQLVSVGNTYQKEIRHNWNGEDKVFVSQTDTFRDSDPFRFYSNGSSNSSSNGVFSISGATISDVNGLFSASFSSPNSTGTYPPKPSMSDDNFLSGLGWQSKEGLKERSKALNFTVSSNAAVSRVVTIPALENDQGAIVNITILQRQFHSGPTTVVFERKYMFLKKPSDGIYYKTIMSENYTADQWSVAPDISFTEGNELLDIMFSGTPNDSDGYGVGSIVVSSF